MTPTALVTLKILIAVLSGAVLYFYLDGRRWRGHTVAANRRRKRVEAVTGGLAAAAEGDYAHLSRLYSLRGNMLRGMGKERLELRTLIESLKKEIDQRAADRRALVGQLDTERAEHKVTRDLLTSSLVEKAKDVRYRERNEAERRRLAEALKLANEASEVLRRRRDDLEALGLKQAIDIAALRKLVHAPTRSLALVRQIENLPPETEAISGTRFRLQEFRLRSKRWALVRRPNGLAKERKAVTS